jgi:PAS domain-containing protein
MYDEAGAISSFVHVIENITRQRQLEDARRQSEERFAASFRHAVIGMAIVSPEGMFLKGNQALCNMLAIQKRS